MVEKRDRCEQNKKWHIPIVPGQAEATEQMQFPWFAEREDPDKELLTFLADVLCIFLIGVLVCRGTGYHFIIKWVKPRKECLVFTFVSVIKYPIKSKKRKGLTRVIVQEYSPPWWGSQGGWSLTQLVTSMGKQVINACWCPASFLHCTLQDFQQGVEPVIVGRFFYFRQSNNL